MPRKAAKKKAPKPQKATPSKRQQVIEHLAANPKATSAEVSAAMKEKGVEISTTYVANIKSTSKTKGKRGRKAKPAAKAPKQKTALDLATAAQLVAQLGGIEQAKKTIGQLEEIEKLL